MKPLDLNKLEKSFTRFLEMYHIYREDNKEGIIEEAVKEALAQRFEYCVEIFWKTIGSYMEQKEGVLVEPSPKKVIRLAETLKLLDAERWLKYIDMRQLVAHDCDEKKLEKLLTVVDDFADDGQVLLNKLKDNINE